MLVGLCGGICAGKDAIADYLIRNEGFQRLQLVKRADPGFRGDSSGQLADTTTVAETQAELKFEDAESLLDFVTRKWKERWVTTDIWHSSTLDRLLLRPFFLLVNVDAPVSLRWQRYRDRCLRQQQDPLDLEQFVLWSDRQLYERETGGVFLADRAQVRLFNSSSSLPDLHAALKVLELADEQRLRPAWDQYFMELASLAAQRSNCMKRRVGCVLVRDRRVISTGYNGTPRNLRNCNEGGCPRCNRGEGGGAGLSTCLCLHAEENALLEAGRERIREGAILYCDTCPCLTCTVKITQVGISEVVYSQSYNMDNESAAILNAAGIRLRQFSPPRNGLVFLQSFSSLVSDISAGRISKK